MNIGINNALCYDPDETKGAAPTFITPPAEAAQTLMTHITNMTQEMYRMAGLSFALGVKQEVSGVAKAWEFERTNQNLATFAQRCKNAEMQIMNLFLAWIKQPGEYNVTYANDFGIVDVAQEINTAQAVKDLELTPLLIEQILRKVLAAYLPDLSDKEFNKMVADVVSRVKYQQYEQPAQQQVDPTTGQPVADNTGAAE